MLRFWPIWDVDEKKKKKKSIVGYGAIDRCMFSELQYIFVWKIAKKGEKADRSYLYCFRIKIHVVCYF